MHGPLFLVSAFLCGKVWTWEVTGSRLRELCTGSLRNSESGIIILRSVSSFTSPNNCWGASSLVASSGIGAKSFARLPLKVLIRVI